MIFFNFSRGLCHFLIIPIKNNSIYFLFNNGSLQDWVMTFGAQDEKPVGPLFLLLLSKTVLNLCINCKSFQSA